MSDQETNRDDKARVSLALPLDSANRVAKGDALKGNAPTDEELAALIDQRLQADRRTEILSHIANDPLIYKKWLRLVEASEIAADVGQHSGSTDEASPDTTQASTPLVRGVSQTTPSDQPKDSTQKAGEETPAKVDYSNVVPIRGSKNKPQKKKPAKNSRLLGFIGAGMAASAALLMVNVSFKSAQSIDGLYDSYGQSWSGLPAYELPTRSVGGLLQPEKSAAVKVLETGLVKGLDALGPQFQLPDILRDELANVSQAESGLDASDYDLLKNTGQFATIAKLKCDSNAVEYFYQSAHSVGKSLSKDLAKLDLAEAKAIAQQFTSQSSDKDAVCTLADQVLKTVN